MLTWGTVRWLFFITFCKRGPLPRQLKRTYRAGGSEALGFVFPRAAQSLRQQVKEVLLSATFHSRRFPLPQKGSWWHLQSPFAPVFSHCLHVTFQYFRTTSDALRSCWPHCKLPQNEIQPSRPSLHRSLAAFLDGDGTVLTTPQQPANSSKPPFQSRLRGLGPLPSLRTKRQAAFPSVISATWSNPAALKSTACLGSGHWNPQAGAAHSTPFVPISTHRKRKDPGWTLRHGTGMTKVLPKDLVNFSRFSYPSHHTCAFQEDIYHRLLGPTADNPGVLRDLATRTAESDIATEWRHKLEARLSSSASPPTPFHSTGSMTLLLVTSGISSACTNTYQAFHALLQVWQDKGNSSI